MRTERDFLGEVSLPDEALYGVQTYRATQNFPISGITAHAAFIRSMALVKKAAATANLEAGRLEQPMAEAILQAVDEVLEGKHDTQFVVDVYQAGAGTSFHMNMNEVLANRAAELMGGARGDYELVHPNDHVNLGQSTNDVFPTSMRLAALQQIDDLLDALQNLQEALDDKAAEFSDIVKSGRTHLQDAAPMILGQEFGGYARAIERSIRALGEASEHLRELGIGGSAVGTGLTAHAGYRQRVVDLLAEYLDTELVPSVDKFEAMQSNQPFALVSSAMRSAALELTRIANDLRLLSSGPRTGLGDIRLPAVQPGSSIMPGKVNPVMAEVMNMVAFQVVGFDATIAMAVQAGQMELNVMMPAINYNLLQGMIILGNCVRLFTDKCVRGIEANETACREHLLSSVGLATILKPIIGYAASSEIAKESIRTGQPIGRLAVERGLLSREQFEKLVAPEAMDIDRAHPKDTETS